MAENLSAHELLVQFKHGNIAAFEILYGRYAYRFIGYAIKHASLTYEDAEECVQNIFYEKIFQKIDSYDETRARGGGAKWLWTICKNAIIDFTRGPHSN